MLSLVKKLVLVILLTLGVPGLALAFNCQCGGGACTEASATNWTTCNSTFPQATDTVVVNSGGTFNLGANATYVSLNVKSGGTFAKSVNTTVTLTLTGATSATLGIPDAGTSGTRYFALWCEPGSTCTLSKVGETAPIIISWTGDLTTACGGGACDSQPSVAIQFGQTGSVADAANDTTVRWRGVSKASTSIASFSEGTTTGAANFADCVKMSAAASPALAIGDTVVFTSGRSKGYWGAITQVACGAGCGDCPDNGCGGVDCDFEVTRNSTGTGTSSTGASWSSFVKASGRAANARQATPDDADANGTADSTNTRPQNGDGIEVFLPTVVKGGANAYINGPTVLFGGVALDMRYVEGARLGATSGECTADQTLNAWWMDRISVTSAEGELGFINIHDFAGRQSNEWGPTDISGDSRANRPVTANFWYIHDADQYPQTCNAGGVSTQSHLGGGTKIYLTNLSDTESSDGMILKNHHYARLYAPAFIGATMGVTTRNAVVNQQYLDMLIHDSPPNNTFPQSGLGTLSTNGMFGENVCHNCLADGIHLWDIGTPNGPYRAISIRNINEGMVTRTNSRVNNAYVVNVDKGGTAANIGNQVIDLARSTTTASSVDTSNVVLSNSYVANNVGIAGVGGAYYFSYFHNPTLSVAGGACPDTRTSAFMWVEDFIGNVVYRDISTACYANVLSYDHSMVASDASCIYTGRKRRIFSNVIKKPLATASNTAAEIFYRTNAPSSIDLCGWDIYNNLFDHEDSTATSEAMIYINQAHDTTTACGGVNNSCPPVFLSYNVLGGGSGTSTTALTASNFGATVTNSYNRFYRIGAAQPVFAGGAARALQTGEVDSDNVDGIVSRSDNFWQSPCGATVNTANVWGGPVGPLRYGIQSFKRFHPAALLTFDAAAFKMRDDWRECSSTFQLDIPR